MNLKIATWNIDRLKFKKNIESIKSEILKVDADIFILTEYNNDLELPWFTSKVTTEKLPIEPYNYKETERRVALFSKFEIVKQFQTYNPLTSCCIEIKTSIGNIIVYGTIVGITGNTDQNFKTDLISQIRDIDRLSKLGRFCYVGDLNISFSDNYYFTHFSRTKFVDCFERNGLINLTADLPENVDHIVVSDDFISSLDHKVIEWNIDKKLSDHKGVCVEFCSKQKY